MDLLTFENILLGAWRTAGLGGTRDPAGKLSVCCPRCPQPTALDIAPGLLLCPACDWTAEGEPWEMAAHAAKSGLKTEPADFSSPISLASFMESPVSYPPEIIGGLLYKGCKMIIGGPSKARKSWSLIDMGISVGSASLWWGLQTRECRVCYLNFELQPWMLMDRIRKITDGKRLSNHSAKLALKNFDIWNLRGHNAPAEAMVTKLMDKLRGGDYGLIIMDPVYKALGEADENSATDIARLMDSLERLAQETGAAVVLAHHFAKGSGDAKSDIDLMSGSGVFARDPDSVIVMRPPGKPKKEEPPEDENRSTFTISAKLRGNAPLTNFRIEWKGAHFEQIGPQVSPAPSQGSAPKANYKAKSGSAAERFGPIILKMPPLGHGRDDSAAARWLAFTAGVEYDEAFKGFESLRTKPGQPFLKNIGGRWQGADFEQAA